MTHKLSDLKIRTADTTHAAASAAPAASFSHGQPGNYVSLLPDTGWSDSRFRAQTRAASPLAEDLIDFVPDFFTARWLEISHCAFHVRVP